MIEINVRKTYIFNKISVDLVGQIFATNHLLLQWTFYDLKRSYLVSLLNFASPVQSKWLLIFFIYFSRSFIGTFQWHQRTIFLKNIKISAPMVPKSLFNWFNSIRFWSTVRWKNFSKFSLSWFFPQRQRENLETFITALVTLLLYYSRAVLRSRVNCMNEV